MNNAVRKCHRGGIPLITVRDTLSDEVVILIRKEVMSSLGEGKRKFVLHFPFRVGAWGGEFVKRMTDLGADKIALEKGLLYWVVLPNDYPYFRNEALDALYTHLPDAFRDIERAALKRAETEEGNLLELPEFA